MGEDKNHSYILDKLMNLMDLHEEVNKIDISLEKLYPVTVIENNKFNVFDIVQNVNHYKFILSHDVPHHMQLPDKILAAFPLDFYNMKSSAVITPEVLDNLDGLISVLHEFVHCYQYENGEFLIKDNLEIHKQAMINKAFMWELDHPFPYSASEFTEFMNRCKEAYHEANLNEVRACYDELRGQISNIDYEYLIWQEWKEGYARFIENKVREHYNENIRSIELNPPYDRTIFYALGSRHIDLCLNERSDMTIVDLYRCMYD